MHSSKRLKRDPFIIANFRAFTIIGDRSDESKKGPLASDF
jgi:hypothetical protein